MKFEIDITVIDGQHYMDMIHTAPSSWHSDDTRRHFRQVPIDPVTAERLQQEIRQAELTS